MSTALNVFLIPSARTPRMDSLKPVRFLGLASSTITTSVYSGTWGRRAPRIIFTSMGFPCPGMDAFAPLGSGALICFLMLSRRA